MNERTSQSPAGGTALLGCIADDVTGATDLALNLVQGGMRVIQWLGLPSETEMLDIDADAIVIALKSRSVAAEEAADISLQALGRLRAAGCRRFYFKYCSTFDSTDEGNIGPVAMALLDAIGGDQTIFCPAFPDAGRTVYAGHLFVHERLLNESGMQDHPLNPMHDPFLIRVLARQTSRRVGLLHYRDVKAGPEAVADRLRQMRDDGWAYVVVDALDEQHLRNIAAASVELELVTGGSGLARFLPEAYRAHDLLATQAFTPQLPNVTGRSAILSGSCSPATCAQVARQCEHSASWQIDVARLMQQPGETYCDILSWVKEQPVDMPLLVYSTAASDRVAAVQQQFGRDLVAGQIEFLLARIAVSLVGEFEVRRLIVAGGETSAAVAAALGVRALRIGPEIAPGVPWTESLGERPLALAFKSGNFGDDNFFQTALEMLS